jgi:hypothetical protein
VGWRLSVAAATPAICAIEQVPEGDLSLHLVTCLSDPKRCGDITKPPSCHGKSLAEAVDRDDAVIYLREVRQTGVRFAGIVDILIYLIAHDVDIGCGPASLPALSSPHSCIPIQWDCMERRI